MTGKAKQKKMLSTFLIWTSVPVEFLQQSTWKAVTKEQLWNGA